MIDYEKSAELNGMGVEELKVYFERFPKSEKRIVRICDCCGGRREIYFYQYCDLCQPCSKKTPKSRKSARSKTLEQWKDPEYYNLQVRNHIEFHEEHPEWANEQSKRLLQYHKDNPVAGNEHSKRLIKWYMNHPEAIEDARLRTIEQFATQESRNEHSKRLLQYHIDNPDAVKEMSLQRIQYYIDNPEVIEKIRQARLNQKFSRISSIEIKMQDILKLHGYDFETQVPLLKLCIPDILFFDKKIIIQCDGDYWHNYPEGTEKDREQDKILTKNGWEVIRFWEHEINENIQDCFRKFETIYNDTEFVPYYGQETLNRWV